MMDSWPLCRSCRRREREVRKREHEAEDVLQTLNSCLCARITHTRMDNRGRRTLLQIGGLNESLCFSAHSSIATGPALMGISTKKRKYVATASGSQVPKKKKFIFFSSLPSSGFTQTENKIGIGQPRRQGSEPRAPQLSPMPHQKLT